MKKIRKLIFALILIGVIVLVFPSIKNKFNFGGLTGNNGSSDNNNSSSKIEAKATKYNNVYIDKTELSEKEKKQSLAKAKEEIANEDIENNYMKLFENKTYTNSNFKYELNKDTVSITNFFAFETNFYDQFEKALNRKENFLVYTIQPNDWLSSSFYGYVEGLGYIIGISCGEINYITIENKYYYESLCCYERSDEGIIIHRNSITLKSNNDLVKVATKQDNFTDYKDNMFVTSKEAFFQEDGDLLWDYLFYEGDILNVIAPDKAYHVYGIGECLEYSENSFKWQKNTRFMTDFNNLFVSYNHSNSIFHCGLFGEVADVYLKKLLVTIFSNEVKECNNFEDDRVFEKDSKYFDINGDIIRFKEGYGLYPEWWTFFSFLCSFETFGKSLNFDRYNYDRPDYLEFYQEYYIIDDDGKKRYYVVNPEYILALKPDRMPYMDSYIVKDEVLIAQHWDLEWNLSSEKTLKENNIAKDIPKTLVDYYKDYYDKKGIDYSDFVFKKVEYVDNDGYPGYYWCMDRPDIDYCDALYNGFGFEEFDTKTITSDNNMFNCRFS